jgi:hypothetical protein
MGYLKQKHNTRLVFDPTIPDINLSHFPKYDWTEFYGDVEEALPPDMPEPLGKEIDLRMMVDRITLETKRLDDLGVAS